MFFDFVAGTREFLTKNAGLLAMQMEAKDTEDDDSCNKEIEEKKATLQKWSRGLHHFVKGGRIIEKMPSIICVCKLFVILVVSLM